MKVTLPRIKRERFKPVKQLVRDWLMIGSPEFGADETAAAIVRAVASRHGVTVNHIRGKRRTPALVAARHEAVAELARLKPKWPLPRIAQYLGYSDHTSVIHALARMGERPFKPSMAAHRKPAVKP
jgi:chromosomal replication initiation ATPase DnaA